MAKQSLSVSVRRMLVLGCSLLVVGCIVGNGALAEDNIQFFRSRNCTGDPVMTHDIDDCWSRADDTPRFNSFTTPEVDVCVFTEAECDPASNAQKCDASACYTLKNDADKLIKSYGLCPDAATLAEKINPVGDQKSQKKEQTISSLSGTGNINKLIKLVKVL